MKAVFAPAALSLLAAFAAPALAADLERALSVEQNTIAAVKPTPSAEQIKITTHLNKPSAEYRMGENVELTVHLSEAAYLTVLNVDSEGAVTILYPNRFNNQAFVPGGKDLLMPGDGADIVASGTPGVELIKVIASEKPLDVTDLGQFQRQGAFESTSAGAASGLAAELSTRALTVTEEGQGTAGTDASAPAGGQVVTAWGEATLSLVTLAGEAPDAPLSRLTLGSDKPSYAIGEEIRLTAAADADCRLNLIAVGPTGNFTVLTEGKNGIVLTADETQEIGPFQAGAPGGIETIRGFCASAGEQAAKQEDEDKAGSAARDVMIMDKPPAKMAIIAEATLQFAVETD